MPKARPVPSDRPVRVGIVGLGQVYELNARAYRDNPGAEVVALCDVNEERLARRGADWPAATRFTDLDRFLEADIDLAEVLVPSPAHCEVVCAALDAGRHVNVQKPMASSLEEADRMLDAARRSGAVLRVMEDYVFYEPLLALKHVVESGEIGDPVGFHMKMVGTGRGGWDVPAESWMWQLEQTREGLGIMVYDDGWHKFAVARWLFGPVQDVMAWVGDTPLGGGYTLDAPSTVMWNHTSGLRGVLDITVAPDMYMRSDYYSGDERFEVTGTQGFARVNHCTAKGLQQPALEVYREGVLRSRHDLDDDWGATFRPQADHLLEWLRTGEGPLWFDGQTAREVLAFTLGALESSQRDARVTLSGSPAPPGPG